jgi:hypothetical protein
MVFVVWLCVTIFEVRRLAERLFCVVLLFSWLLVGVLDGLYIAGALWGFVAIAKRVQYSCCGLFADVLSVGFVPNGLCLCRFVFGLGVGHMTIGLM